MNMATRTQDKKSLYTQYGSTQYGAGAPSTQTLPALRSLSSEEIAQYHAEGYVIVRNFFDATEIEPLRVACEADPSLGCSQTAITDHHGRTFKAAIWTDLGDTMLGVLPRMPRMVNAAENLLGKSCYHWHSKIVRKQPNTQSVVNFHQDYWFWYYDGCLFPDLLTCTIAVDRSTQENGCLQVVKKSHLLGRLDQVKSGNDYITDLERLDKILETHELIDCEMEPGDVVFFHANTLHGSGPNLASFPRTVVHCTYNASANAPYKTKGQAHHQYRPLVKIPDSVLRENNYDSVFEKQKFHTVETDENSNNSIFRRNHPGNGSVLPTL